MKLKAFLMCAAMWAATCHPTGPVLAGEISAEMWGVFDSKCEKSVFIGAPAASQDTTLAANYNTLDYEHDDITHTYSRLEEWALGTTDELEVCFNPPNELSGVFLVTMVARMRTADGGAFFKDFGKQVGEGVGNGDEVGLNLDQEYTSNKYYDSIYTWTGTVADTECMAPMVKGSLNDVMGITDFQLTILQLDCKE